MLFSLYDVLYPGKVSTTFQSHCYRHNGLALVHLKALVGKCIGPHKNTLVFNFLSLFFSQSFRDVHMNRSSRNSSKLSSRDFSCSIWRGSFHISDAFFSFSASFLASRAAFTCSSSDSLLDEEELLDSSPSPLERLFLFFFCCRRRSEDFRFFDFLVTSFLLWW